MANNKIMFDLEFNLDQTNIKLAKDAINELKSSLKKDYHSGIIDTESFKKATSSAKELEKVLNQSFNNKIGQLNMDKLDSGIRQSFGSAKQLKKTFEDMGPAGTKALNSVAASAATTGQEIKKTSKLIDSMAESMKNTLKWGVSSAIFNSLTRSVQQAWGYAKNLDASLNDIRIVTGDSAEQMERFAQTANKAAKSLGASTLSYTNAALIYYQQGLDDSEAQARASTTLKAANITGQSADVVSEQLTAVWNGYKVSAEEAELYVDKLQAVAEKTASDLQELSTGMSKVASAANLMGVDMDSLNAQLATIISVTKQAPESVGTALKTIYARMGDIEAGLDAEVTLGEYTSQMAEMGVNVLDANGKLRDMKDVIEEIGGNWKNMTREQQLSLSQTMAGTRQYNNLLALFDNWGMYTEALNTSANAAGALNKANEIYMESVGAHLQELSTEAQRTYDVLFDTDTVNGFIDIFSGVLGQFNDFIEGLGGGANALVYFGAMFTKIFKKQIANEIIIASSRLKDFTKSLTQAGRKEVNTLTKEALMRQNAVTGGVTDSNSKGADAQLAAANQIYKVKQGLTQEEIKQSEENARQIGLLTNQLDIQEKQLEKEKLKLKEQKENNKSNYNAFNEEGGLKSREQIAHDIEIAQVQMSEVDSFMEQNKNLDKILTKLERRLTVERKIATSTNENNRKAAENIKNTIKLTEKQEEQVRTVTQLVDENSNLLNLTEEQKQALSEAVLAINSGKYSAEQYKVVLENAKNLQNQGNLYIEEGNNTLKIRTGVQESVNDEIREELNLRKQANAEMAKKGKTNQNTQNAISYLMDASMIISSMAGAWESFNDEAATGEQKAHAVGSAIGGVASSAGSIIGTIFGGPAGGMIGGALGSIAGSIGSIIFGLDNVEDKFKSTQEKLKEIQEKNKQFIDEISGINNNISSLQELEEEYERLSKKAGDYNENIQNLTEEEKARYAEIKNKIIEFNQEALIGYDVEGNAILDKNAKIQDTIDLLKQEREEKIKNLYLENKDDFTDTKNIQRSEAKSAYENAKSEYEFFSSEEGQEGLKSDQKDFYSRAESQIIDALNRVKLSTDDQNSIDDINNLINSISNNTISLDQKNEIKSIMDDIQKSNPVVSKNLAIALDNYEYAEGYVEKVTSEYEDKMKKAEVEWEKAQEIDVVHILGGVLSDDKYQEDWDKLEQFGADKNEYIANIINAYGYEGLEEMIDTTAGAENVEEVVVSKVNEMADITATLLGNLTNPEGFLENIKKDRSEFENIEDYNEYIVAQFQGLIDKNIDAFETMGEDEKKAIAAFFGLIDVQFDDDQQITSATTQYEQDYQTAAEEVARNIDIGSDATDTARRDVSLKRYFGEDLIEDGEIIGDLVEKYVEETGDWYEGLEKAQEEYQKIKKEQEDLQELQELENKAEELGYSKEEFKIAKNIVKERVKENKELAKNEKWIARIALQELETSKAIKAMASGWNDLKNNIQSTDIETKTKAVNEMRGYLQQMMLFTDEEMALLPDNFVEKNVQLFEDVVNGADGALEELQLRSSLLVLKPDIDLDNSTINTALTEAISIFDEMNEQLQLNPNMDLTEYYAGLNELIRATGLSTAEAGRLFQNLGYNVEIDYATANVEVPNIPSAGGAGQWLPESVRNGTHKAQVKIPAIRINNLSGGFGGGIGSPGSGDSGGGGGSTNAPDERDEFDGQIDKYNEVNGALTRINNSLEEQDKLLNKVTGKDKIKGYDKQLSLLNKQNKALKEKKKLLKDEAKDLKTDLTKEENLTHGGKEYKFDFDKNGNITNYNDVLTSIENDINEKIKIRNQKLEGFDNLSDEEKKKRQEEVDALDKEIDDYESFFDRVKGWADRYGTIINDEIPGVVSEISDNLDKEIEAKLAKLELKVQLKVDFRNARKSLAEFQKSNISEYNLVGLSGKNKKILDAYTMDVTKNKKGGYTTKPGLIDTAMTSFDRAYDAWYNIRKGETDKDYGLDSAKAFEAMQTSAEEMVSYIEEAQGVIEETWGYYEQGIENANTALTEHIGQYDKLTSKVQYFLDLQELQRDFMTDRAYWTAQKDAYTQMQAANTNKKSELKDNLTFWKKRRRELMETLFTEKELNNIKSKPEWDKASSEERIETLKTEYQKKIAKENDTEKRALLQKDYDDLLNSEAWQGVNDNIEETQNNIQETTKNTLENINKIYEATKELARLNLSDSIFGESFNLEKEQEKWEIFLGWQDKYLDSVTKNFKINDFVQKINDALENTDSLAIQERLNKLKEDELELLNQKGKVTQQDLDRMNKMLDVELKRIALEEAQKNKSTMRLRRDASGNYSYQYVADQEDIDKKQQELTKAEADWHADTLENFGNSLDNLFTLYHQTEELIANGADYDEVLNQAMPSFTYLAKDIQQLITDLKNQGMTDDEIKSDPRYASAMQLIDKITSNALITKEDGTTETVSAIKALFLDLGKEIADAEDTRKEAANTATEDSKDILSEVKSTISNLLEEGTSIRTQQTNILETLKTNFKNIKDSLDAYLLAAQGILKDFRDIAKQNASGATGTVSQRVVDEGGDKNAKTNEINVPTSSLSFQSLPENFDITNPLKSISAKDAQRLAPYIYEIDTEVKKAWIEDKKGIGDWVDLEKSIKKGTKVLLLKSDFTDKGGEPAVTVEYLQDGKAISNIIKAKTLKGFDTGGYTGSWSGNKDGLDNKGGRLALLHQKELILNPKDTENFLAALKELKQIQLQARTNIRLEDKPLDVEAILKSIDESLNNTKEKINAKTKYQLEFSLNTKEFADKLDALVQDKANLLSMTSSEFEKAFKNVITDTKTQSFKQNVQINAEFPGVNNSLEIERAFNSLTSKAQRYMVDETAI